MKKLVALLMAAALGVSLALCGCGSKDEASSDEEKISGGWTVPDSVEVTDEVKTVLNKATKEMTGADYEPVALLGTQVVAGTNYSLLCQVTPVAENAETHYSIVVVYNGADGTTSVVETHDFSSDAE